jgi:DNA repair exonuclease SbcCD ATPase subunit
MHILSAQADNFLSYEHFQLQLDNLGLVLIEGENRDSGGSNGAGKSALFEAMTWGLFGVTNRGLRGDDVVRLDFQKKATKNTRILVEIEVDGHLVQVLRHRKHAQHANKLLLFVDGKDVTLSTDKETQERLNHLLQIDVESFISAVMFPQGASGFASLTDGAQKAVLDRILGTERFAAAQERAKAKVKKLETGLTSIRSSQAARRTHIAQLVANVQQLCVQQTQWELQHSQRLEQLAKDLQKLFTNKPVVDPTLPQQLADKQLQISQYKLHELHQQLEAAQAAFQNTDKQLAAWCAKLDTLQNQVASAGPEPEKPVHDLNQMNDAERRLREELLVLGGEIRRKERELASAEQRQASRDSASECPTCGSALSEAAKDRMFGQLASDISQLRTEVSSLQQKILNKEVLLEASSAAVASLNRKAEAWRAWKTRTESGAGIPSLEASVQALAASLAQQQATYSRLAADYKTKYDDCLLLHSEAQAMAATKKEQDAAWSRWELEQRHLEAQKRSAELEQSPYVGLIAKARADRDAAHSSIATTEQVEKVLARDLQYLQFWAEGFGNSGVKSLLFDTVTPYLSYRASQYLEALTGGTASVEFCTQKTLASGDKRDKFEVQVSYSFGGNSYASISGGERRRIDLAALFALGDLAASRSFAPIRLRLLDEPFDNLDSSGAEAVVHILKTLVLPNAGTVLVMTHDDNLKSLVDKRIVVIKENGISRIESR